MTEVTTRKDYSVPFSSLNCLLFTIDPISRD